MTATPILFAGRDGKGAPPDPDPTWRALLVVGGALVVALAIILGALYGAAWLVGYAWEAIQ